MVQCIKCNNYETKRERNKLVHERHCRYCGFVDDPLGEHECVNFQKNSNLGFCICGRIWKYTNGQYSHCYYSPPLEMACWSCPFNPEEPKELNNSLYIRYIRGLNDKS